MAEVVSLASVIMTVQYIIMSCVVYIMKRHLVLSFNSEIKVYVNYNLEGIIVIRRD